MASVSISGDVSGAISIAAPSAAGSGVLTLPTGTDTLIGKATTDTLTNKSIAATQLTGTIAAAALPAGSVIQVVNSYTAVVGAAFLTQATVLELSITPRSASNKVMISYHIGLVDNNAAGTVAYTIIRRGGSAGTIIPGYSSTITAYCYAGSSRVQLAQSGTFIDSPATTSATTYGVYIRSSSAGTQAEANGTTIILTEIQG
jgi:hypothetical protein